jgi:molecular chaperone DnaK (HSP70)
MAMKDSEMSVNDVHEVILVGDFTQTPMISKMIQEMFPGKIRLHEAHSHFLACYGAALEAAVVLGVSGQEHCNLLKLDATSRGLGLETGNGNMTIMIYRNTSFPCQKKHTFTTTRDNQTEFIVKIFEGDSDKTTNNECQYVFSTWGHSSWMVSQKIRRQEP